MTVTPRAPVLGRGVQATAGVMVLLAGVLEIVAQLRRWSPCLAGYTTTPCGLRQDHRYDSFLPIAPWTPEGPGYEQFAPAASSVPLSDSATPSGVAFLLLALAFALTARTAGPRRTGWAALALTGWWGFTALVAVVGVVNVASGLTGSPLALTATVATAWWWLGPLLGIGLAVRVLSHESADLISCSLAAVLVVVGLRNSLAEYMGGQLLFDSHDTPPFQGGPGVVALTVLGAVLIVTAARPRRMP